MISIFVNRSRESQPLKSHWIKFYCEIWENFKAHYGTWNCQSFEYCSLLFIYLGCPTMELVLVLPIIRYHRFIFTLPGKKKHGPLPALHPLPCDYPPWKQPACWLNLVPKLPIKYLFWRDPGAFPLVPPRLQHGYKAGEDNSSSQDTKHPCKALYVQGTSFLLCVHWGVQVTLAILWPPFVLQDIHITILLKLQNPWRERTNHVLQLLPDCTALPFIIPALEDGGLQGDINLYRLPCRWNARTQKTLLLQTELCHSALLPPFLFFFFFWFHFMILNILPAPICCNELLQLHFRDTVFMWFQAAAVLCSFPTCRMMR